ncbi:protein scabrous-like [Centruroides vittatus]|uniref:protein scabrous-like n=1 Tax=Centruroides vittatus TaxID=120091 RepID=UPI00350F3A3F
MAALLALITGCLFSWCFATLDIDTLSRTVAELKLKVSDLQTAKNVDRQTIRHLESQLQNRRSILDSLERDRTYLNKLENQLRELKSELRRFVGIKERETEVTGEVSSLWLQTDSLREEIGALRRDIQSVKTRREEDEVYLNQAKSNQVSSKWVQRNLDELRNQIADVARAVNLSASLTQKQNVDSNLKLVRKDFLTFRKELEEMKAAQKRSWAGQSLTQQDLSELRWRIQKLLVEQAHQNKEVNYLREEILRHPLNDPKMLEKSTDVQNENEHKKRHHWKAELSSLKQTVAKMAINQAHLLNDLQETKQGYTDLNATVHHINQVTDRLYNQTMGWQSDHDILLQEVHEIRERFELLEEESSENREKIHSINHSVASIDKLHDSTMQLFKTMGSMEDKYDKNMHDLQKEMSKLEYVVSQVQTSYEILHENQADSTETLRNLKNRFTQLQYQIDEDRVRLVNVQHQLANKSLNSCWERNDLTALQVKMNGLEDSVKDILNTLNTDKVKKEVVEYSEDYTPDCSEISTSGIHLIKSTQDSIGNQVYCDGNGWTTIQKRQSGGINFNRGWISYKQGFGHPSSDFWCGNELLYNLTNTGNYTLRIDMWDVNGVHTHAIYDRFRISSESNNYQLHITGYSGTAGDALKYHQGMFFSTWDQDNDATDVNCALIHSAGWWYNNCQNANLNADYRNGLVWYDPDKLESVHLSRVEMKIRK